MGELAESPTTLRRGLPRLVKTQRTFQIILGLFWLLDAGLQFQPFIFGNGSTPYTTMVWQVPVAGGPLAIQPPDIQTVESAVMAAAG